MEVGESIKAMTSWTNRTNVADKRKSSPEVFTIQALRKTIGEEPFRHVIQHAPPGVFSQARWTYWHPRLRNFTVHSSPAKTDAHATRDVLLTFGLSVLLSASDTDPSNSSLKYRRFLTEDRRAWIHFTYNKTFSGTPEDGEK